MINNFAPLWMRIYPHLRPPHHQGGCDKAACKFDHDLCLLTQRGEIISEETSSNFHEKFLKLQNWA